MRPRIVIAILLAGAAGLAALFFLKQITAARTQLVPVLTTQSAVPAPTASAAVPKIFPATDFPTAKTAVAIASRTNATAVPDADHVQQKINRLQELETHDDDASLKEILASLTDPNKIIRHEAIEATIQFGGHTAVPVLRNLAAQTSDADEKKELLDAADFLELPTLTEVREEARTAKSAPGQ